MINYETGNDFDAVFIESELELFNNHSKRSPQDEEYKKFIIVVKKKSTNYWWRNCLLFTILYWLYRYFMGR